jgi:heme exporter protein D
MMPELGKYAGAVLSAYGISLFLLFALIGLSWARARRMKAALAAVEAKNG